MFKRKIKLKDNRFIEKIEEFLGTEIYQNPFKGQLTSEELAAFRYDLGEFKVKLKKPKLIERIGINDLFNPEYCVLTIKESNDTYIRFEKVDNYSNIIPLLNQRIILFKANNHTISSIRIYIPAANDIIIYLNNLDFDFIDKHFDFRDVKFFVQEDGEIVNKIDWSREFFAHTNQKIDNASIVLHYVP